MDNKVPLSELQSRMCRFRQEMDMQNPDWRLILIFSKLNQYYFTGTMQEGMLVIPRESKATLWVRRSYERALNESEFADIRLMQSYCDAACAYTDMPDTIYTETDFVTLSMLKLLKRYFKFSDCKPADLCIANVRAVKSEYELDLMIKSGEIHKRVLEDILPSLLYTGMSEAELGAALFSVLLREGYHGISRFSMHDTEMLLGNIAFGESSIYPTSFNGPGGNLGLSAAVPVFGNAQRRLKEGDLVFIDIGCGYGGYHTDKTMTYVYHGKLPDEAQKIHDRCVDIELKIADMLRPKVLPSEIYKTVMDRVDTQLLKNFMGYGSRKVKFLGHGIGLTVDEMPVIANGFDRPLCEGMVMAVEPKCGIKDIGMVGIENTFLVNAEGGISITGESRGLLPV